MAISSTPAQPTDVAPPRLDPAELDRRMHGDLADDVAIIRRYSGKDIARARRASAVTLWAWCEMHEAILRELRRRHGF